MKLSQNRVLVSFSLAQQDFEIRYKTVKFRQEPFSAVFEQRRIVITANQQKLSEFVSALILALVGLWFRPIILVLHLVCVIQ